MDLIELVNQKKVLQEELDNIDEIIKNRLDDIYINSLPSSIYLALAFEPVFYLVDSLYLHAGEIHCDLVYNRFNFDSEAVPWSQFETILKELYIKYGLSINIHFKDTSSGIFSSRIIINERHLRN